MSQESALAFTVPEIRGFEQAWRKAFPVKDFGQTTWHIHGSEGTLDETPTAWWLYAHLSFDIDPVTLPAEWEPIWRYPKVVGHFAKIPVGQTHADLIARLDAEGVTAAIKQQVRDKLLASATLATEWQWAFKSWLGMTQRVDGEP